MRNWSGSLPGLQLDGLVARVVEMMEIPRVSQSPALAITALELYRNQRKIFDWLISSPCAKDMAGCVEHELFTVYLNEQVGGQLQTTTGCRETLALAVCQALLRHAYGNAMGA